MKITQFIKKNIKKITMLSIVTTITALSLTTTKTYAYTIDTQTGNMISENLANSNYIPIPNTEYRRYLLDFDSNATYYFTIYDTIAPTRMQLYQSTDNGNTWTTMGAIGSATYNPTEKIYKASYTMSNYNFNYKYSFVPVQNVYGDNYKIMCSKKQTLSYEPYGEVFYSQDNYNDAIQDAYNEGVGAFTTTENIFNGATIQRYSSSSYVQSLIYENVSNNGMLSVYDLNNYIQEQIPSSDITKTQGYIKFNTKYRASDLAFSYQAMNIGECYVRFGLYDLNTNTYIAELSITITNLDAQASTINLKTLANANVDMSSAYLGYVRFSSRATFSQSSNLFFTFDAGYSAGYANGLEQGKELGIKEGFDKGKDEGYRQAMDSANKNTGILANLFNAIFTAPVNWFKTMFDVSFFGINLSELVLGLVMALLVGWLIKRFI